MTVQGVQLQYNAPAWQTIRYSDATLFDPSTILSSTGDSTTSGTGAAGTLTYAIQTTIAGGLQTDEYHLGGTLLVPLSYSDGGPVLVELNRPINLTTRLRWDPTEPNVTTDTQVSLVLAGAAVGSTPNLATGVYAGYGVKWDSVLAQKRTQSDLNGSAVFVGSAATAATRMYAQVACSPTTTNAAWLVTLTGVPMGISSGTWFLSSPGAQNTRTGAFVPGHRLWIGLNFGRVRNTAGAVTFKAAVDYRIGEKLPLIGAASE
jgi:hypothetical protein